MGELSGSVVGVGPHSVVNRLTNERSRNTHTFLQFTNERVALD